MSTRPAQSSLRPKVELLGFNGRILRLPPLALGAVFSVSRVLYICAVLAVSTFPAFIVPTPVSAGSCIERRSASARTCAWWAYNVFTYSINCFFCSGVRSVPKL
jgi:hypothetical protein